MTRSRPLAVAVSVATAGAAFSLVGATAGAAPSATQKITGGHTTVFLDHKTTKALKKKHVAVAATGQATLKHHKLRLPLTGGTVNLPNYVFKHGGGFKLTHGSQSVKVTHIVLRTKNGTGTAKVSGLGRIRLLSLGTPTNGGPGEIGGYPITLTASGVKHLDNKLSTTVFAHHPLLGAGDTKYKAS